MRKIGDGSFGNVYLKDGKAIKRCFYDTKPVWMLNLREMDIMHRMKGHPYMVKLEEVIISQPTKEVEATDVKIMEKISLVMEYIPTTLQAFIDEKKGLLIDEVRRIMAQLLVAIEYMHINRIVHRDLKPTNILYDEESGRAALCDFGMCDIAMNYSYPELEVTAFIYRAPEIFCGRRYSSEVDLWALGCIMYFLKTGNALFPLDNKIPNKDMLILQKETTSKKLFKESHDFREVLEGLLKMDPRERISATQALSKRFFDPVRKELIDPVRKNFPVIGIELERVTLDYLPERRWIKEIIQSFVKTFKEENIGVYPVIFHGLEIFERYLVWAKDNQVSLPPSRGSDAGRYLTRDETTLYLYTCLFIAHKYYSVVDTVCLWNQFFPEGFRTIEHGLAAEAFEETMITEVLKYSIWRYTLYEIAEDYIEVPTYKDYLQILNIYLTIPTWKNDTYRKMFREVIASRITSSY